MNTKTARKSRGAPIGNLNNLKHGFYSTRFTNIETSRLSSSPNPDILSEINLLRSVNDRLLNYASTCDNPAHLIPVYDLIGKTSTRIASLIKAHAFYQTHNQDANLNTALCGALEDLYKTLDLQSLV